MMLLNNKYRYFETDINILLAKNFNVGYSQIDKNEKNIK